MSTRVKVFKFGDTSLEISACSTKDGAQLDILGEPGFQLRLNTSQTLAVIRALAYALMIQHRHGYMADVAANIYGEAAS